MARRKNNKRRLFRGILLIGTGAGAVAFIRGKLAGGDQGAQAQSHQDAARPTGQEQRPMQPAPVRPAEATGEGTGSETVDEDSLTKWIPDDAVKPDTSIDDPLVKEETEKAAAEAGAVGGNVQQMAADEPGFPSDPEMRPVEEGAGNDAETAEQVDAELGGNRETK
jgi:hypothetical protein